MNNGYLIDLQNDYNNFKGRFEENRGHINKAKANEAFAQVISNCFSRSKPSNERTFTGILTPSYLKIIDYYLPGENSFNIYEQDDGSVQIIFEDYVILIDMETGDYTIKEGTRIK